MLGMQRCVGNYLRSKNPSQAKISDLDPPLVIKENVGRLDVAMKNACAVDVL